MYSLQIYKPFTNLTKITEKLLHAKTALESIVQGTWVAQSF